jgi:hypothetical protein
MKNVCLIIATMVLTLGSSLVHASVTKCETFSDGPGIIEKETVTIDKEGQMKTVFNGR